MRLKSTLVQLTAVGVMAGLGCGGALAADPAKINWSKIPAQTISLFYPG